MKKERVFYMRFIKLFGRFIYNVLAIDNHNHKITGNGQAKSVTKYNHIILTTKHLVTEN